MESKKKEFDSLKTEKSKARVYLPSVVLRDMKHWQRVQTDKLRKFTSDFGDVQVLQKSVELMTDNEVRPIKIRVLKRSNELRAIRNHDFRHTYAAIQISIGTDIYRLKELMRHSNISITADTYGYLYDSDKRDAANALNLLSI